MEPENAWWRRPSALGGFGVALLLGGYAALSYVPPAPEVPRPAGEERVAEVGAAGAGPPAVPSVVESRTHVVAGRVAFYTGLALVLAAAVRWYREPPAPAATDEEEPGPDAEAG
jgi:hypothetical protein